MRKNVDEGDVELKRVLNELLQEDTTISYQEIVRRHPYIKNASSISRSESRCALVADAQEQQRLVRSLVERGEVPQDRRTLNQRLDDALHQIDELKGQVKALVASHAACVRAVHVHGGTRSLMKFWKDYEKVHAELLRLNAIPEAGNVVDFKNK